MQQMNLYRVSRNFKSFQQDEKKTEMKLAFKQT